MGMQTEPGSSPSPAQRRTYKTVWRKPLKKDGRDIFERANRRPRTSASPPHLGPAPNLDSSTRSDSRNLGTRLRPKVFLPDSPGMTVKQMRNRRPPADTGLQRKTTPPPELRCIRQLMRNWVPRMLQPSEKTGLLHRSRKWPRRLTIC